MTTTLEPKKTDLSLINTAIDEADTEVLTNCITEIGRTRASIVQNILAMGEQLANVRDTLEKYGSKAFAQFLNSDDVQLSRRAAEEYMHAYYCFAEMPEELTYLFAAKAIYRLSAPTAPEDAADAAIEKAKQGVRVNEKAARDIVAELMPRTEPEPEPIEPWNEPLRAAGQDLAADDGQPATEPDTPPSGLAPGAQTETRVSDSEPEPGPVMLDEVGHRIEHLESVANVFSIVRTDWDRMMGAAKIASDVAGDLVSQPVGEALKRIGADAELQRLAQKLFQIRPYSVCPQCEGHGCTQCGSRGWVIRTVYLQSYTQAQRDALAEKLKESIHHPPAGLPQAALEQ